MVFVLWDFFPHRECVRCISSTYLLSPLLLCLSGHRVHIQFIGLQQLHNKFIPPGCCLGIWSDSSIAFWAVCKGSYGARGRFVKWRQLHMPVKKYRMSNMEWHLHEIKVNIWHAVASSMGIANLLAAATNFCLLLNKLLWEIIWIREVNFLSR